jgi:hypothetical protein
MNPWIWATGELARPSSGSDLVELGTIRLVE